MPRFFSSVGWLPVREGRFAGDVPDFSFALLAEDPDAEILSPVVPAGPNHEHLARRAYPHIALFAISAKQAFRGILPVNVFGEDFVRVGRVASCSTQKIGVSSFLCHVCPPPLSRVKVLKFPIFNIPFYRKKSKFYPHFGSCFVLKFEVK